MWWIVLLAVAPIVLLRSSAQAKWSEEGYWRMVSKIWTYEANPADSTVATVRGTIVVVPFQDDREMVRAPFALAVGVRGFREDENDCYLVKEELMPDGIAAAKAFGIELSAEYAQCFPTAYARWLAKELAASGRFQFVRFLSWGELAALEKPPDWIVSGTIQPWLMQSKPPILPIEIFAFRYHEPESRVWSKTYAASDNAELKRLYNKYMPVWTMKFPIVWAPTIQPIFLQVRRDLAEALKP